MLSIVKRGYLLLGKQHWHLVIELIYPLMIKFKYKTELFLDNFVNMTLLGYKFSSQLVDKRTLSKSYEYLIDFAESKS